MRTSLKSSKGWRKYQKNGEDEDSDEEAAKNRLIDSGDDSDDFYDRTKKQAKVASIPIVGKDNKAV